MFRGLPFRIAGVAAVLPAGLAVPPALAVVPEYQLLDLGSLGGVKTEAWSVNDAGRVAGWGKTSTGSNRAFITAANSPVNPVTDLIPLLTGGTQNFAYSINSAGQVAGDGNSSAGDRAFLFSDGTLTNLGTIRGGWSYGNAINNAGQIAGSSSVANGPNANTHASLYSGSTMYDLGTINGGANSGAYGINSSGQVIGYSQLPPDVNQVSYEHAFVWTPSSPNGTTGTMLDILGLGGGYSYAWGINDAGAVVGVSTLPGDSTSHAFLRTAGDNPTMVDLLTLGGDYSEARAINDLDMIVGNSTNSSAQPRAFLWADGTMHDLNELVPAGTGWTLTKARDINNLGQIVGVGTNSLGELRSWLLSPVPTWKVDADGAWSATGSWIGGIPDGVGAEVRFTGAITAPRTVTLDISQVAGHIVFDSANRYTLAGPGTLTIRGAAANTGIEVRGGGHTIAAPLHFEGPATISLADGAALKLSGPVTGSITALHLGSAATLDLVENDLIINYRPADGSPLAEITAAVTAGRNGGSWNGAGVTSSAAALLPANPTAIAVAEASALGVNSFNGTPLDGSAILLKYTYAGDATLDGKVDVADLGRLATSWQQPGGWIEGDFNYDGTINVGDLGLLATNWQAGPGDPLGSASFASALAAMGLPAAPVPEPGMGLACIAILSLAVSGRRSRN